MALQLEKQNSKDNVGGLSHLVEAATALTELVDRKKDTVRRDSRPDIQPKPYLVSDDDEYRHQKAAVKAKKREIFPQRLMEILSNSSLSEVIAWLPHGKSFVIIRPDLFTEQVLPKYMPPVDSRSSTKYPSFTRKLNRWGFRQATRGPDTGAFHHALFRRDRPELCLKMVCQKSRERQAVPKRSLPPKKRAIPERQTHHDSTQTGEDSSSNLLDQPSSASNILVDEKTLLPAASMTAKSNNCIHDSQSSILSKSKDEIGVRPFISSDAVLVAKTLKQRDTIEVARAAKSMLYDAFLKALRGEGV